MKISELIEILQLHKDTEGDIRVCIELDGKLIYKISVYPGVATHIDDNTRENIVVLLEE